MRDLFVLFLWTGFLSPIHGFSFQVTTTTTTLPKNNPLVERQRQEELREKASQVWKTVATARPLERDNEVLLPKRGEIPRDLSGTYYVNGLASCDVHGRLVHPFESHGFFKAVRFPGGRKMDDDDDEDEESAKRAAVARLSAKYVQTPVRRLESLFRRPLFRGAMSSVAGTSSVMGRFLNALSPTERETANLAVRPWGEKLLVTADNCPFYRLDPHNLETLGIESFNGALDGYKMLAHTRMDQERQRLIAAACKYDINNQATVITFFEFDKDGTLVSKVEHTQSPACIFHDWMITQNYYIVPAAAATFDLSRLPDLITGKIPATKVFSVDESAPASVLLIPRNPDHPKHRTTVQATMADGRHGVVFHMGPCHEKMTTTTTTTTTTEEDSSLEISLVLYPMVFQRYQFGGEMGFLSEEQTFDPIPWSVSNGGPLLEEWKVTADSVSASNGKASITSQRLHNVPSDMPTFHPEREGLSCRYLYTVCGIREQGWFPFNAIAKHDLVDGSMQIWPPEAAAKAACKTGEWDGGTCVWSEPLFVPRGGGKTVDNDDDDDDATKQQLEEEDDGYILSTCHDSINDETSLHIFDARHLDRGPLAETSLGQLWGWNIHSSFAAAASQ